jgi:nicotinamidase-related amidase
MRKRKTLIPAVLVATAFLSAAAVAGAPQIENRMKPVLLVIDIQNQFLNLMSREDRDLRMYVLGAAVELFRAKGYPIVRVYHTDPESGPKPGTEAFEFPSSVPVKPEDPMVVKNHPNAFKKTNLDALLRDKGCNTVFLCGLSAVGCVLATDLGGEDLGYTTFMIKDAVLSHNAEYTRSVESIRDAVGYKALKAMLENALPEKAGK